MSPSFNGSNNCTFPVHNVNQLIFSSSNNLTTQAYMKAYVQTTGRKSGLYTDSKNRDD